MIIVTAILNGVGAGILWVSQAEYVTLCATEETKGFYFSYFFIIFMISQIAGNLGAAFMLRDHGQPPYYILMTGLSLAGCLLFLLQRAPRQYKQLDGSKPTERIQDGSTILVLTSHENNRDSCAFTEPLRADLANTRSAISQQPPKNGRLVSNQVVK